MKLIGTQGFVATSLEEQSPYEGGREEGSPCVLVKSSNSCGPGLRSLSPMLED